jgi:cell division protein FtsB
LSKNKLLRALQSLREKYIELEDTVSQLKAENAKLKEQLKSEKIKSVNRNANKPSSKQAE